MSSSSREIFDRKKSLHTHTDTHKHLYRNFKNYIPPIYFVYAGGIIKLIKIKLDPLRAVNILMRKVMGHTTVSATQALQ